MEIAIGLSMPSRRVTRELDALVAVHGAPCAIRVDNGPESTAQPFVDWCADHRVTVLYIQPGKPDQNAYIERFKRTYRAEVLNAHLVESVAELRALTDAWLIVDNRERPHDSLGRVPPLTFLPRPSITRTVFFSTVYLTGKLTPRSRVHIDLLLEVTADGNTIRCIDRSERRFTVYDGSWRVEIGSSRPGAGLARVVFTLEQ